MTPLLWMLAGAGAQTTIAAGALYALRGRIQARVAAKLTAQMQHELAQAMPGLAGADPAAMLGALLAHAPADALGQTVLPPRLADELAGAVVTDPTQAQMREHRGALGSPPFDQAAGGA